MRVVLAAFLLAFLKLTKCLSSFPSTEEDSVRTTVVVSEDAATTIISEVNETVVQMNESSSLATQERLASLERKMDTLMLKMDELINLTRKRGMGVPKSNHGSSYNVRSPNIESFADDLTSPVSVGYLETLSVENYDHSRCRALWIETVAITLENHLMESSSFSRSSDEEDNNEDVSDYTTLLLVGCQNGTMQVWDEMQYRMDDGSLLWLTLDLRSQIKQSTELSVHSTSLVYLKGFKAAIAIGMRDFGNKGECITILLTINSELEVTLNVMDYSQGRFDLNSKECMNNGQSDRVLQSQLFQIHRSMYVAQWLSGNRVVIARTSSGRVSSEYRSKKVKMNGNNNNHNNNIRDKRTIWNQFLLQMNYIKRSGGGFSLIRRSKKRGWALALAMHRNLSSLSSSSTMTTTSEDGSESYTLSSANVFADLSLIAMPIFSVRQRSSPIYLESLIGNSPILDPLLLDVRILGFVSDRRLKSLSFAITVALRRSDDDDNNDNDIGQGRYYESAHAYLSALNVERGDQFGHVRDSFLIPELGLNDLFCLKNDSDSIQLSVISGYLLVTSKCTFNVWWFNSTSVMKGIGEYVRPMYLGIERMSLIGEETKGASQLRLIKVSETGDEIPKAIFLAALVDDHNVNPMKENNTNETDPQMMRLTVTVSESRAESLKIIAKKKGLFQRLVGSPFILIVVVFLLGTRGISGKKGGSGGLSSLPGLNVFARMFGGKKRGGMSRRRQVPMYDRDSGRRLTMKERWQMRHPNRSTDEKTGTRSSTQSKMSSSRRHSYRNPFASDSD